MLILWLAITIVATSQKKRFKTSKEHDFIRKLLNGDAPKCWGGGGGGGGRIRGLIWNETSLKL